MAILAKQFTCFFLISLSTCCQTQARESKFFSKYAHISTNNFVTVPSTTNLKINVPSSPTPSSAPTTSQISGVPALSPLADSGSPPFPAPTPLGAEYSPAPTPTTTGAGNSPAPTPTSIGAEYGPSPAPAPAPFEDELPYYGLYGKNTNEENVEEFSTENPEEMNSNREVYTYTNGNNNNNNFLTSNYKTYYDTNNGYDSNSGYKSKPQGTRIQDNKYYYDNEPANFGSGRYESQPQGMSDTRNSKFYYNTERQNYSPNGHESEQQGISDNRMEDNNKYYYDNEHENYRPSRDESEPQGMSNMITENNNKYYNGVEQENYSPVGHESNNEEGYYDGGSYNKSKYEFDSMEEYEKQQGYADVQQEFINP